MARVSRLHRMRLLPPLSSRSSPMIGKGIKYGYVCTGEAFVFLHIPDDPTTVRYHVCVPNLDVLDDDENRLRFTVRLSRRSSLSSSRSFVPSRLLRAGTTRLQPSTPGL
ncbi:hypothetical protein CDEST_02033 [Colletotrichum destructivum]|uniref:Uncharacterized protein n=1 Tax=Colletotrichum destructivum TaxID=34406 RepID=A0AAX4I1T2_9PEZI|nr:hypothetical protein CDEST_02033 [Colletotrichum destructivum]